MKWLVPRPLRALVAVARQLSLGRLVLALTSQAEFAQLLKPLGSRPLILAPHPGDEVMAMGGTMAAYGRLAVPLAVLTVTAGRRGTNTGRISRPLGPRRRGEQLAGFVALGGVIRPHYWDLDEGFMVEDDLIGRLTELLDELNPDIIYTPSLLDSHPDSQELNALLAAALSRLPSLRTRTILAAQYELWTPLIPNKILSIDDWQAAKAAAIACHESQLLCRNYLEAMIGLNRYRAAMLGAGQAAEAFFICRAGLYVNLATKPRPPANESNRIEPERERE